ncbi:MAG: hypothetical protein M3296_05810, partial [Actinomycetota bacterium]|nr:hypothetical protein [Actinomycetota bacterium]
LVALAVRGADVLLDSAAAAAPDAPCAWMPVLAPCATEPSYRALGPRRVGIACHLAGRAPPSRLV